MKVEEAVKLIEKAFDATKEPALWAELGCGNGTFTNALSEMLTEGSVVYAIDKLPQIIVGAKTKVSINFQVADFEKEVLVLSALDGILMANALHFVKDKVAFFNHIKKYLDKKSKIIIVEYDTETPNQWVPYPIGFNNLKRLFIQMGFSFVEKMAEVKSVYGNENIYSVIIRN